MPDNAHELIQSSSIAASTASPVVIELALLSRSFSTLCNSSNDNGTEGLINFFPKRLGVSASLSDFSLAPVSMSDGASIAMSKSD